MQTDRSHQQHCECHISMATPPTEQMRREHANPATLEQWLMPDGAWACPRFTSLWRCVLTTSSRQTGYNVGQTWVKKLWWDETYCTVFRKTVRNEGRNQQSVSGSGKIQMEQSDGLRDSAGEEEKIFKCWEAEKSLVEVQMDEDSNIIKPEGSLLLRQTARSHLHATWSAWNTHTHSLTQAFSNLSTERWPSRYIYFTLSVQGKILCWLAATSTLMSGVFFLFHFLHT